MFGIGQTELLILAGILLLLFGASRLPTMMRNMGRSVNEFKQGLRDEPKEMKSLDDKSEDKSDGTTNESRDSVRDSEEVNA